MKRLLQSLFGLVFFFLGAETWALVSSDPAPLGEWQKACQDIDGDIISSSIKVERAPKVSWLETDMAFENPNCQKPYLKFQKKYQVSFSGSNMDLTLTDVTYTPLTGEVAASLNEAGFCDIKFWTLNKEQSIMNKICADEGNYASGQKLYSIIKIIDSNLFIGVASQSFDGSTPAKRHLQFETKAYAKVVR